MGSDQIQIAVSCNVVTETWLRCTPQSKVRFIDTVILNREIRWSTLTNEIIELTLPAYQIKSHCKGTIGRKWYSTSLWTEFPFST